ncbi:pyruvate decarboxylase-like protein [Hanseniaspora valbyensis NRRL Y-1626]|uniref:Pyruvate decarboxylase-like protein n=1 Tax=Hanseniaspora valbyensis NRRL Y-1626 TaxID=766949 RepID=A0A1B7TAA9_9ASCO|nr:pyruvate decarboxylase-like protein [Hanseniaspora valbyensis NRRL Y-1626]
MTSDLQPETINNTSNFNTTEKMNVGTLLFKRLSKVTKSVFGVPGDFNLKLLENIYKVPELKWVGNNNELNAAYVADGYSRINPHNFACLITTYGVGELSALNGIAGSFTENIGVLHIVGTSASRIKKMTSGLEEKDALFKQIHHLIPGPKSYSKQNHEVYENIVAPFSCVAERLTPEDVINGTIQFKIDNAISTVIKENKPGYLFIPSDISEDIVPCNLSLSLEPKRNEKLSFAEKEVLSTILNKIYEAKNVGLVADYFLKNDRENVENLLEKSKWPVYSTPGSRGLCFDESIENFKGVFCNETSHPNVLESVKNHDLILHLGSNINETSFRYYDPVKSKWLQDANIVFLGKEYAMFGFAKEIIKEIDGVKIFRELFKQIQYKKISEAPLNKTIPKFSNSYDLTSVNKIEDKLFENQLSYELSTNYLQENDIVICEMTSFTFEMENIKLPKNARAIAQGFYASIGYALPACVGVCKALKDYSLESKHRVVLIQGDGSAQMTLQEFSLFLAHDLKPVIFMLNNSGYTIERAIMGETSSYNDLTTNWKWTKIFEAFGDELKEKHESRTINNYTELKEYMQQDIDQEKLQMVELILQKCDYSNGLKTFLGKP